LIESNPWKKNFRETQSAAGGLFRDFSQRTYRVMGQTEIHRDDYLKIKVITAPFCYNDYTPQFPETLKKHEFI
jgi:hypothetical protein